MLSEKACIGLTEGGHWFRFNMPYLFQKLELDGHRYAYLPLNRNYKPLGYLSSKHVEYRDYAAQAVRFARNPALLTGIWRQPRDLEDNAERLWLYSDALDSRTDYFARLESLMARSMPLVGLPKGERNLALDPTPTAGRV